MRFAVYFAPSRSHPLSRAAAEWLGRDAFDSAVNVSVPEAGLEAADWLALTAEPRRYGFHATLKAPFSLAPGLSAEALSQSFHSFCQSTPTVVIPRLVLAQLGPFFALVPGQESQYVDALGAAVVRHFEPFRAPLSEADVARRKPERLTPRQRDNLDRWGYPYVFEEFRFHMTLTGPVDVVDQPRIRDVLERRFKPFLDRPLDVDHLGLFVEEERGAAFTVADHLPLNGAPSA